MNVSLIKKMKLLMDLRLKYIQESRILIHIAKYNSRDRVQDIITVPKSWVDDPHETESYHLKTRMIHFQNEN